MGEAAQAGKAAQRRYGRARIEWVAEPPANLIAGHRLAMVADFAGAANAWSLLIVRDAESGDLLVMTPFEGGDPFVQSGATFNLIAHGVVGRGVVMAALEDEEEAVAERFRSR